MIYFRGLYVYEIIFVCQGIPRELQRFVFTDEEMRPVYGRLTKAIGYGEVYIHVLLRLYIITTINDRDVFISFDKSKKCIWSSTPFLM